MILNNLYIMSGRIYTKKENLKESKALVDLMKFLNSHPVENLSNRQLSRYLKHASELKFEFKRKCPVEYDIVSVYVDKLVKEFDRRGVTATVVDLAVEDGKVMSGKEELWSLLSDMPFEQMIKTVNEWVDSGELTEEQEVALLAFVSFN